MVLRWKSAGAMGAIDLRKIGKDDFVIHFGGEIKSVDAYTFANSLISIADTVTAINSAINPGQKVEVRVEAVGPGSFRAKIKKRFSGLSSLLATSSRDILLGILGALIYDNYISSDDKIKIITEGETYIVESGETRVILPKEVYEALPNVRENPDVQRSIQRTFQTLENDPAIENFGITPDIDDETPLLEIPREGFYRLSEMNITNREDSLSRIRQENARLLVRKVWLEIGGKKWSFEWNGIPLSAPMKDDDFLQKVASRVVLIGAGDVLEVELSFLQTFDSDVEIWVNDSQSYKIINVIKHIPKSKYQNDMQYD